MKTESTKKLITLAMLAALSYLCVVLIRIPVVGFLSYEPKDVIIVIAGFLYGPLEALIISAIVSTVEMVTISSTGWIGAVMNFLSTAAFAVLAAAIYRKKRSMKNAVIGMVLGVLLMTAIMLLWNYILTPIYMGYPRDAVAAMLPTVFLPFNLIKGALNTAITLLLYKPLVIGLRKARLLPPARENASAHTNTINPLMVTVSLLVILTCVLLILIFTGVL